MIDFLEQPQQQQIAPQLWLQHQQQQQQLHQQSRGPNVQPNMGLISNNGQVIQHQAALNLHHNNNINQPLPAYQKHNVDSQQSSEIQQVNGNNNTELIGYYFGSISRETAEWILKNHANQLDGAYLLRSSGPKDDFVLSLMVMHEPNNDINHQQVASQINLNTRKAHLEVLHYRIVETEDSFVALHGQIGNEKFATIDELIEKAQGVATKPKWPIQRQSLESQILPPTFWGLTVDQVRLAILIKAKQWGFPLSIFQQPLTNQVDLCLQQHQKQQVIINTNGQVNNIHSDDSLNGDSVSQVNLNSGVTTLNNETIRTLIYKSLHEFQPWFHGKISREEAERRIEDGQPRDGRFLVRERDNTSYAMCISHKKTTKHYRIDVLPTGELAIQDGRKFTSLMALVSHYTIMSDGLWCALTEPCPRPIQANNNNNNSNKMAHQNGFQSINTTRCSNQLVACNQQQQTNSNNNIYCVPPPSLNGISGHDGFGPCPVAHRALAVTQPPVDNIISSAHSSSSVSHNNRHNGNNTNGNSTNQNAKQAGALMCPNQSTAAVLSIKAPIKELLHTINHKWSQSALNSFLFGASNPLNNHCQHHRNRNNLHHQHHARDHNHRRRTCTKEGCLKHSNQSTHEKKSVHKTPVTATSSHQQRASSRLPSISCDCCYVASNSVGSYSSRQDRVQTMIQNRMQQPPAGGIGRSMKSTTTSLSQPTTNNLILQYIGSPSQHAKGNNGCGDQLVTGGVSVPVGATQGGGGSGGAEYTKVLLSCLPQNSGFMLDSQSFIGSPLFAVKTHCSNPSAGVVGATIDGFASRNGGGSGYRANSTNGSSGSGGGCANGGNNMAGRPEDEKLISPAQSVSANLNNHQTTTTTAAAATAALTGANPYALNTSDIYGSQTSTAIVNDHLLTGSSSSPSAGNSSNSNNGQRQNQQQQSVDLKQHRAPPSQPNQMAPITSNHLQSQSINFGQATNARCGAQNAISHSNQSQLVVSSGGGGVSLSHMSQPRVMSIAQHAHTNYQPYQVAHMGVSSAVDQPGPIFCGQHAGPAYRYTNCTGDQSLARPCNHTRTLGGFGTGTSAGHPRALDDSQLMTTPSSQLGGPAALTKFVQFQDGQCLRTHRDTRSIQMAYLLSRQEALNVLNSRNGTSSTMMRGQDGRTVAQGYTPSSLSSSGNQNHNNRGHFTSATTKINNIHQQSHQIMPHNGRPIQTMHQVDAATQEADFDLMDCDGNGFQFKYDPKLIKSSSIETLCGAKDEDEDDCLEDLSNFKTNSELLMSLKSCWPNYATTNGVTSKPTFDILSPIIPSAITAAPPPPPSDNNCDNQNQEPKFGSNFDLNSLMLNNAGGCHLGSSNNHTACVGELDESFKRTHDLDDLTTTLLAELTASLKAQVDLKNKRSGLGVSNNPLLSDTQTPVSHNGGGRVDGGGGGDSQDNGQKLRQDEQANPRELINEFDTLVATTNKK